MPRKTARYCPEILETSRKEVSGKSPGEDAGNPGYSRHSRTQIVSGYTETQAGDDSNGPASAIPLRCSWYSPDLTVVGAY